MQWFKTVGAASALLMSSFVFAQASSPVGEWEMEAHDEDKDIKVYTRSVGDSPLKEFKGVTHINAPVEAFVALLRDPDVATSWMHDVVEFKVMESPSETENLVYTINKTPWPVTDRDAYILSEMSADEHGVVTTTLTAQPSYQAENEDYIRMPALSGHWKFTPQENGVVEVEYQVHANPGGSLPNWLVNAIVVDTPLNTLSNLRDIIQDEKYQNQSFAFIEAAKTPVQAETIEQVATDAVTEVAQ